jgi:tetratricopeptide (TPR) repeat protein
MLWTLIATGKRPFKHGIHGFSEPTPDGRSIQPVSNLSRTCKAVWNIFNQNGMRSNVIGWWPSHPAEPLNGVTVSDHFHRATGPIRDKSGTLFEMWPPLPAAVHPRELLKTLAELRFHPDELVQEMVTPFIPLVAEIDQAKDKRVAALLKILCECITIHSVATWLMDNKPWDFFGVYFDAIDHFCHGFMKYHPPRQAWIAERDFELYSGVVTQAYLLHDQMLGTLLQKAGPDTTVILMSDHGFHPDHLRPREIPDIPAGPAIEHSDLGIFAVMGPGIRKDELIYGASVLDIAPTLLALYGLPVGEDMDGHVLTSAFDTPLDVKTIPSWEDVPGEDGRHPEDTLLDPIAAREALEQMVALGYIEKPDDDGEEAVAGTVRELRYNLAESYQNGDRHEDAAAIFRELYDADSNEQRFGVGYFVSCQALRRTAEMRRIVEDMQGRRRRVYVEASRRCQEIRATGNERLAANRTGEAASPALGGDAALDTVLTPEEKTDLAKNRKLMRYSPAVVDYLESQLLTAEKSYEQALECLRRITDRHIVRPGLLVKTGDLYRKLHRYREARATYRRALEIDPDNAHAHLGMCRIGLMRRKYEAAAGHALDCLQRLYHYPVAHYLLGIALTGMEENTRAATSFRTAIAQNPNFPQAHLRLAELLEEKTGDSTGAREHRLEARRIRRSTRAPALLKSNEAVSEDSPVWSGQAPAAPLSDSLVVVTGLPRAGTSMLMQMLAAGGMPVLTDDIRTADEDNPRGYYEFEPVKKLMADSRWLSDAKGKAVKIVAPLVPSIPRGIPLRLIVIERDLDEILASQEKMIQRRGEKVPGTVERRDRLKAEYRRALRRVAKWVENRQDASVLALSRAEVLRDAAGASERIREFLDGIVIAEAMAAAVDPSLHRNRRG